ncbi:MAG TPA: helix-turn-helix domain-containing protein [Solirubrobacterales bacterium]|nr:helix-turn-helix domain-containing protein [Solirubrobacterales bacterium]
MLEEHRRRALEHPIRRRILRALHWDYPEAQTASKLCKVIPNVNTSTIGYHLRVLEEGGCVSLVGEIVRGDGVPPTYVSNVADDRTAMTLLHATQAADERDR